MHADVYFSINTSKFAEIKDSRVFGLLKSVDMINESQLSWNYLYTLQNSFWFLHTYFVSIEGTRSCMLSIRPTLLLYHHQRAHPILNSWGKRHPLWFCICANSLYKTHERLRVTNSNLILSFFYKHFELLTSCQQVSFWPQFLAETQANGVVGNSRRLRLSEEFSEDLEVMNSCHNQKWRL